MYINNQTGPYTKRILFLSSLLFLSCNLHAMNDALTPMEQQETTSLVNKGSASNLPSNTPEVTISSPVSTLKGMWNTFLDKPEDVQLAFDPGIKYWLKRKAHITIYKFLYQQSLKQSTPTLQPPTDELLGQELIPWTSLIPECGITSVYTSPSIPKVEQSFSREIASWLILVLTKYFPVAGSPGLPSIPDNCEDIIKLAYAPYIRIGMPNPHMPEHMKEAITDGDLIGGLATKGNYADRVKVTEQGHPFYIIDMDSYHRFPVKDGLEKLGGVAHLKYTPQKGRLETYAINYAGKKYTKNSPEWSHVSKIVLATINTHAPVTRHLLQSHLLIGGTFTAVNNKMLSFDHPLRILFHPHQHLTLPTNTYEVPLLISPGQFAPNVWSFDYDGLTQSFLGTAIKEFKIGSLHFWEDTKARGFDKSGKPLKIKHGEHLDSNFSYPFLENKGRFWNINENYVTKFLSTHYDSDEAMQKDNQLVDWYNELDKRVANGIKSYAGEKPTIKGVAKLGTIFINEVSVTHQSIGHGLSNYTPWLNKLPRQVSKDDALEPIGNSQAYANVALIATAPASVTFATDFTSPDQPFSKVLTTTQKELMKEFLANMAEYNKELKLKAPKEQQLDITFPEDTAPSIDA